MGKIRDWRMLRGLRQQDVADAVGVRLQNYQAWEAETICPRGDNREKLADALGVDVKDVHRECARIKADRNATVNYAGRDMVSGESMSSQEKYFWELYRKVGEPKDLDQFIGTLLSKNVVK